MKKFLKVLGILLLPWPTLASSSNVTATITDADGNTWNNGTYFITFSNPKTAAPTVSGTPVATTFFSGSLSGAGILTVTVTDTSSIDQSGSQWCFTIFPNASSGSASLCTAVTGANPSLSTALSNAASLIRFAPGPTAYGYADVEAQNPRDGAIYYQVTCGCLRTYNAKSASWSGAGLSGVLSFTPSPNPQAIFVNGTSVLPSITFANNAGSAGAGFYGLGGGYIAEATGGTPRFVIGTGNVEIPSTYPFVWSATADASATVDTGISRDAAGVVDVGTGAQGNAAGMLKAAGHIASGTTFTVTSGCGTTTSLVGGATAGKFVAGQAACAPVITPGVTAPNGFACWMNDFTTATVIMHQTATSPTTATFGIASGTAGATDTMNFGCLAY